jgi:hypothetical protein
MKNMQLYSNEIIFFTKKHIGNQKIKFMTLARKTLNNQQLDKGDGFFD